MRISEKNNKKDREIWQILLHLNKDWSEDRASAFSLGLEDLGYSLSLSRDEKQKSKWLIRILSQNKPDHSYLSNRLAVLKEHMALPCPSSFVVEKLPDIDWLNHVYQQFQPITVEPFYIHGSHITKKPDHLIPIEVNAATAFGTGEHATTKGCLQAIALLYAHDFTPQTILDLGCGSGILAMAAGKIWPKATIIGTDMDTESIRVAKESALVNKVDFIQYETATGYASNLIKKNRFFDLILANILAKPLIEMAQQTAQHLSSNGKIILSGMLQTQQKEVQKAHENKGLRLEKSFPLNEWTSLLMMR